MKPKRFNQPALERTGTMRQGRPEFVLTRDFIWWLHYKRSGLCFFGSAGFLTDKLSIPSVARALGCRPDGIGWEASLPHDLGYNGAHLLRVDLETGQVLQTFKPGRGLVDSVFLDALPIFGASAARARLLYSAVDLFGRAAWARPDDPGLNAPPENIPLDLLAA